MKKIISSILLLLIVLGSFAQKTDKQEIKKCFNAYKSAILSDQGQEAVSYLSKRTIAYYNKMVQSSLYADSATIEQMSILDKFMVLAFRHRTNVTDLRNFNGTEALTYAINEGMVGKNSVMNNEVGIITILPDGSATGQMVVRKRKSPLKMYFYKEANSWKLDLTSIFDITEMTLKKL